MDPLSFVITAVAGWMNQHQRHVIEYLMEENRVLREQIGNRRLKFSDDQRCGLAAKAKKISRKLLAQVATIVRPETLLAWHRKLIAQKYDGSSFRTSKRRPTRDEVAAIVDSYSLALASARILLTLLISQPVSGLACAHCCRLSPERLIGNSHHRSKSKRIFLTSDISRMVPAFQIPFFAVDA